MLFLSRLLFRPVSSHAVLHRRLNYSIFALSLEPSLSEGTFSPSFVLSLGKGESELSLFVRVWILTGGVVPLGGTHSLFFLCNRCWTRSPGLMLIIYIYKK